MVQDIYPTPVPGAPFFIRTKYELKLSTGIMERYLLGSCGIMDHTERSWADTSLAIGDQADLEGRLSSHGPYGEEGVAAGRDPLREANRIHCKQTRERRKQREELLREVRALLRCCLNLQPPRNVFQPISNARRAIFHHPIVSETSSLEDRRHLASCLQSRELARRSKTRPAGEDEMLIRAKVTCLVKEKT